MRVYQIYQYPDGHLEDFPSLTGEWVGEFSADAHCDYVKNMIEINIKCGRTDEYWNSVERHVAENGI